MRRGVGAEAFVGHAEETLSCAGHGPGVDGISGSTDAGTRAAPPDRTVLLVVVLLCTSVGLLGRSRRVATNTFEAGYRFDGLMERIRLALDPPPDREIVPAIEITEPGKDRRSMHAGLAHRLPAKDQPRTRRVPGASRWT